MLRGKKGIKGFLEKMDWMGYQVTRDLLEAEELQGREVMMDRQECLDFKDPW